MKRIALLLVVIIVNCSFIGDNPGDGDDDDITSTNFVSLTVPIAYEGEISYLNAQDLIEKKNVAAVKHDNSILGSFPNLVSSVTVYQVDANGSLSLLGSGLSAKNATYIVIYDYAQTQTIQVKDPEAGTAYYALVGVSVRMIARVTTKSRGINLAAPNGLALAASRNKVTGSLEVRANGISSQQINGIIPVTSDLSQSSIANALQAVATIKSHIFDTGTKITPQFLAFSVVGKKNAGNNFNFDELNERIRNYQSSK